MTNHFASLFPLKILPLLAAAVVVLPEARCAPPFVQPDLVVRYKGRKKGQQKYTPINARPLIIRRRDRRPVTLGIELNGDILASAARRDVRVAITGPLRNRYAAFHYFHRSNNISGQISTGAFSGYVDPGLNFRDLSVRIVPKKKSVHPRKRIAPIAVYARDSDTGKLADRVRASVRKR